MNIKITDQIVLEQTAPKHAEALFTAVNNNRDHLSTFLSWVSYMQSVLDFDNYIQQCESLYQQNKDVSFCIIFKNNLVGRIGLHHIDLQHKHCSIGYWLTKEAEGNGIITQSCSKLIEHGFNELTLNRIEIKAAIKNKKSQAIPRRLNFQFEGILREAEYANGGFLSLYLYSLLKSDWQNEK